jgi:hypothetical protein
MIQCHIEHLRQRARERGYTFAQVKPCIVSRDGDGIVVDETHPAYPRRRPGLGDRVEQILTGIGVTKARMQAVTGKPCGCEERKRRLNEIGARLFGMG